MATLDAMATEMKQQTEQTKTSRLATKVMAVYPPNWALRNKIEAVAAAKNRTVSQFFQLCAVEFMASDPDAQEYDRKLAKSA